MLSRIAGFLYVAFLTAALMSVGLPESQRKTEAPKPDAAAGDPLAGDITAALKEPALNGYGEPHRDGAAFPTETAFARDTRTFTIPPLNGMEFNYRMEKGGSMVYSWTASDNVVWDFHGEPKGGKEGYAESYQEGEGMSGNGGFIAPEAGIHGWFWENQGEKPVKVTLTAVGHFTEVVQIKDDVRTNLPVTGR